MVPSAKKAVDRGLNTVKPLTSLPLYPVHSTIQIHRLIVTNLLDDSITQSRRLPGAWGSALSPN